MKVRGFRVEPGEVRGGAGRPSRGWRRRWWSPGRTLPGDTRLVATWCPAGGGGERLAGGGGGRGLAAVVREFAAARLPEYMVPAAVVVLDALPLTANGKVDRAALPAPDYAAAAGAGRGRRRAARSCCAGRSRRCWGWSGSGPEDDFFDLGGHSLLAVRLVSRVRAVLGAEAGGAGAVRGADAGRAGGAAGGGGAGAGGAGGAAAAGAGAVVVRAAAAVVHRRSWRGRARLYNIPVAVRLAGELDAAALAAALGDVIGAA